MSREVRRVPLDFDAPLNETWSGYLMPDSLAPAPCAACNSTGQTHFGWWLQNFSYVMGMLASDVADQECGRPMHPWLRDFSRHHGHFEGTRFVINRPSPDAMEFFVKLADTTPEQIRSPFSCSDLNYAVYRKLLEVTGMSVECTACSGEGGHETYPGQDADREAWTRTEPPTGEGWQLWQTVSEGGPVSVPFTSAEALASWMVSADEASSYETALNFVHQGWAPSGMSRGTEYRTGVDAVGDPDF